MISLAYKISHCLSTNHYSELRCVICTALSQSESSNFFMCIIREFTKRGQCRLKLSDFKQTTTATANENRRRQTKGLTSRTMAVHVHCKSLYISLPSSAKQQREMTKFCVFWRTRTAAANFSYFNLEFNNSIAHLA